ncbi:NUDIX hydrolase [Gaoshiqia sp. Z1-71]|uniref:NUDIX hydrolase n=1 Tax=Gaoshiqia hydrogeniformans TaxID=3290090 RepID=UPI003BF8FEDB
MNSFLPDHIARLLQSGLPGEQSHLKMVPPGRSLYTAAEDRKRVKLSSVLILLFPVAGEIYTCFVKRSAGLKYHPGQVSLPGGQVEEGESAEMAALRETQEEIGVSARDIRVLGRLSELFVQVSSYTVYPFVGWLDEQPEFVLNRDEAEKLILFPVQRFLERREIGYMELETSTGLLEVPYYPCDGEIIWGATAMILTEFLDLLGKPKLIPR